MAEDAGTLWMEMKNIHNISVGMTHDGYLKLYQLSQPRLYQYDVIFIDEAQDLTPGKIYRLQYDLTTGKYTEYDLL